MATKLLRFLRNLLPRHTDIWDWRTYGTPSPRTMLELLAQTWSIS